MSGTIFLIVGLGVCGFIWLLSAQMRGMIVQALFLAAQEKFPAIDAGVVKTGAKATPLSVDAEGEAGQVQNWLRETHPAAVGHLQLARRGTLVGPILMLIVVAVWRFGFGGAI